LDNSVITVV